MSGLPAAAVEKMGVTPHATLESAWKRVVTEQPEEAPGYLVPAASASLLGGRREPVAEGRTVS